MVVPTSACAKDSSVSLTHLFFNTFIIRDIEKMVNLLSFDRISTLLITELLKRAGMCGELHIPARFLGNKHR